MTRPAKIDHVGTKTVFHYIAQLIATAHSYTQDYPSTVSPLANVNLSESIRKSMKILF